MVLWTGGSIVLLILRQTIHKKSSYLPTSPMTKGQGKTLHSPFRKTSRMSHGDSSLLTVLGKPRPPRDAVICAWARHGRCCGVRNQMNSNRIGLRNWIERNTNWTRACVRAVREGVVGACSAGHVRARRGRGTGEERGVLISTSKQAGEGV